MSHFIGAVQGGGKPITRRGTKSSGIVGHLRGWHVGVEVEVKQVKGVDTVFVYRTTGTNGLVEHVPIATYTADDMPELYL